MTDYKLFVESDLKTIRNFFSNKSLCTTALYSDFANQMNLQIDSRWDHPPKLENEFYDGRKCVKITFFIEEDFGFGEVRSLFSLLFKPDLYDSKKFTIKRILFSSKKNFLCFFKCSFSSIHNKPIELGFRKEDKFIKTIGNDKSIKDVIGEIKKKVLDIRPEIDKLTESFRSGEFIEAYNKIYNVRFRKNNGGFLFDCLYYFPTMYREIISLSPPRIPNLMEIILACKEKLDPKQPDFWEKVDMIIKIRSDSAKGARMYEKLQKEFYQGILDLQQELCGKYDIDPSWLDHISYTLNEDMTILNNKSDYNLKSKRNFSLSLPLQKLFPSTREDLLDKISKK